MNQNIKILIACVAFLAASFAPLAAQQISDNDRNRYITQIREYKHDFLAKELKLSKEQQNAFFPVYDEMEDRIIALGNETRELEQSIASDEAIPDIQVEAAAEAVYSQKLKEAQIENEYFSRFKELLTPRQLISLRNTEKKFTQSLVRHHRKFSRERAGEESRSR